MNFLVNNKKPEFGVLPPKNGQTNPLDFRICFKNCQGTSNFYSNFGIS